MAKDFSRSQLLAKIDALEASRKAMIADYAKMPYEDMSEEQREAAYAGGHFWEQQTPEAKDIQKVLDDLDAEAHNEELQRMLGRLVDVAPDPEHIPTVLATGGPKHIPTVLAPEGSSGAPQLPASPEDFSPPTDFELEFGHPESPGLEMEHPEAQPPPLPMAALFQQGKAKLRRDKEEEKRRREQEDDVPDDDFWSWSLSDFAEGAGLSQGSQGGSQGGSSELLNAMVALTASITALTAKIDTLGTVAGPQEDGSFVPSGEEPTLTKNKKRAVLFASIGIIAPWMPGVNRHR